MPKNKKTPNAIIDLENACLSLTLKNQINKAYKLVADHRSKDKRDGSMGIDWCEEKKKGLEPEALEMYQSFFQNSADQDKIPRAALIVYDMMGNPYKAWRLLKRLKVDITGEAFSTIFCDLNKYKELRNIAEYIRDDVEKYQITGCDDEDACPLCKKMNEKIFDVSQAQTGVNLPPFCDHCRCTTVPYI